MSRRYRIKIDATVIPIDGGSDVYYNSRLYGREEWRVPRASAEFEFESKESLAAVIEIFGRLLGAEAKK